MAQPHVVTALIQKRAELAGQIDALQDQLRQAMIDVDHVDCTLRMFDPDVDLDEIRPKLPQRVTLPTPHQNKCRLRGKPMKSPARR